MSRSCSNCRYAVLVDHGYSNYTVEGTNFNCAILHHPDGEFDRWYGDDKRLSYAEKCNSFEEGEPLWIDVDHENLEQLTPEERFIYDLYCKGERRLDPW